MIIKIINNSKVNKETTFQITQVWCITFWNNSKIQKLKLLTAWFSYNIWHHTILRLSLKMNATFIWRVQRKNRRCHKISVPELIACGACLHPIVSIRDMFRGKNRLSPPEDAVDERLSHGKTGSVHLTTQLMKGYPMEKPEMYWPYLGITGNVHNFANVTSPVLPLNPSFIINI